MQCCTKLTIKICSINLDVKFPVLVTITTLGTMIPPPLAFLPHRFHINGLNQWPDSDYDILRDINAAINNVELTSS